MLKSVMVAIVDIAVKLVVTKSVVPFASRLSLLLEKHINFPSGALTDCEKPYLKT